MEREVCRWPKVYVHDQLEGVQGCWRVMIVSVPLAWLGAAPEHKTTFESLSALSERAARNAGCFVPRGVEHADPHIEIPASDTTVVIATHGQPEARRAWPLAYLGPALESELLTWLKDVHRYERDHLA